MANLGTFEVDTQSKYVDFAQEAGITLNEGGKYVFQASGDIYVLSSSTLPKEGGFFIPAYEKTEYTRPAGENLYIRSQGFPVRVNISEND